MTETPRCAECGHLRTEHADCAGRCDLGVILGSPPRPCSCPGYRPAPERPAEPEDDEEDCVCSDPTCTRPHPADEVICPFCGVKQDGSEGPHLSFCSSAPRPAEPERSFYQCTVCGFSTAGDHCEVCPLKEQAARPAAEGASEGPIDRALKELDEAVTTALDLNRYGVLYDCGGRAILERFARALNTAAPSERERELERALLEVWNGDDLGRIEMQRLAGAALGKAGVIPTAATPAQSPPATEERATLIGSPEDMAWLRGENDDPDLGLHMHAVGTDLDEGGGSAGPVAEPGASDFAAPSMHCMEPQQGAVSPPSFSSTPGACLTCGAIEWPSYPPLPEGAPPMPLKMCSHRWGQWHRWIAQLRVDLAHSARIREEKLRAELDQTRADLAEMTASRDTSRNERLAELAEYAEDIAALRSELESKFQAELARLREKP